MMSFQGLASRVIAGEKLTRAQALAILTTDDQQVPALLDHAWQVRYHFHGKRVNIQVLSNAKSGLCSEDCHYCAQSRVSQAEITCYPLKQHDTLVREAKAAHSQAAYRFCMGLSGRTLNKSEVDRLCTTIRAIKAATDMPICCSLGFLKPEQARQLRAAGLDRVNHNLNTSERYYPSICTTHGFADRVRNLKICREAGLEICPGGIVGQGESDEDIVDMFLALQELEAKALPINFLIPVEGTPFAAIKHRLTPLRCLKILALARLMHPAAEIRAAAGREYHLRSLQPMALFIVDSIFVNGYLTESGQGRDEALQMIDDLGFDIGFEFLRASTVGFA